MSLAVECKENRVIITLLIQRWRMAKMALWRKHASMGRKQCEGTRVVEGHVALALEHQAAGTGGWRW